MTAGESLERALTLWGDTVYRLAYCKTGKKNEAEDITQTVFLKLHQREQCFESDEHVRAWLLKTTVTTSIDMGKLAWNQRRSWDDPDDHTQKRDTLAREEVPFCDTEESLRRNAIVDQVVSLPEKQRVAVHLHYFEGYSTTEIAQIMDENVVTVRSHLHRARKALKQKLGRYDG